MAAGFGRGDTAAFGSRGNPGDGAAIVA